MLDSYLRDAVEMIRKGQYRRTMVFLEKHKVKLELSLYDEMRFLRRQVHCATRILSSYLERNEDFERPKVRLLMAKLRLFLIRWYELLKQKYRNTKPNLRLLKDFLLSMLSFTQVMTLHHGQKAELGQCHYFHQVSVHLCDLANHFRLRLWKHTQRDTWSGIIIATVLLTHQSYHEAAYQLEANLRYIQKNCLSIHFFKIKSGLTELDIHKLKLKQIQMILVTFILLAISYFYADKLSNYYELIKLAQFIGRSCYAFPEILRFLKSLIKSHSRVVGTYLQEVGEIQRIMSMMVDQLEVQTRKGIKPLDQIMYEKMKVHELNRVQVLRVPSVQPLKLSSCRQIKTVAKRVQTTNETLVTQQSQTERLAVPQRVRNESFSNGIGNRQSIKYFLDRKISDNLKRDSFFSYNDVSRDVETNISMESDQQKGKKAEAEIIRQKRQTLKPEMRKMSQKTKNALYNLIEAQSLYYMEVQKANQELKQIKNVRDQQQKRQMSDKLISELKSIKQQPTVNMQSQDLQETEGRSVRKIYQDVYQDLKQMADSYITESQKVTSRYRTLSQQMSVFQSSYAKQELAESIIQSRRGTLY